MTVTQALSKHGVGASEISAIAGLNPFASAWDVWLSKRGLAPDVTDDESEAIEWGHRNEPAIRQKYADVTGATMHVPHESLFHREVTWARATPDAIVLTVDLLWDRLMQVKNVGYWPGRDWHGGPPAYVVLQEQWELFVTGLERADVAALIGGSEFRVFTVHRDDKMIDDLVAIGDEFWRRVVDNRQPAVDHSEACRKHFEGRLRGASVDITADEQLEGVMAGWRAAHRDAKRAEREVDRHKNLALQALADAGAARISSSQGAAALRAAGGGGSLTDWKLIAELLGSTKCTPDEFAQLVAANTKTREPKLALYPPAQWSKDH